MAKNNEIAKNEEIAIYFGKYDGKKEVFKWSKMDTFKTLDKAYTKFYKLCSKYLSYDYDELVKEFGDSRLDIEILVGNKMVKWFGLYDSDAANSMENDD